MGFYQFEQIVRTFFTQLLHIYTHVSFKGFGRDGEAFLSLLHALRLQDVAHEIYEDREKMQPQGK